MIHFCRSFIVHLYDMLIHYVYCVLIQFLIKTEKVQYFKFKTGTDMLYTICRYVQFWFQDSRTDNTSLNKVSFNNVRPNLFRSNKLRLSVH